MKKRILRYVKHIALTLLVIAGSATLFGLYHGASLHYADNPLMMDWDKEGPYIFYQNDSLIVNYVRGNQEHGFYVDRKAHDTSLSVAASCRFPLDGTTFQFKIEPQIERPQTYYTGHQKILAISDIESGFRTFRDFLIGNEVIDSKLNWIFGTGHLVLLGDFVDRDFSTTQVLWFIYKLEKDAQKNGGSVHFILGNHELKNMQGNYESNTAKYFHISSILQKKQTELYDQNSFIGRWMASKNTIESINGILFAHGGIHPGLLAYNVDLDRINHIIRDRYYTPYYPKAETTVEQFLTSTKSGIAWYRGYFKDGLDQEQIERILVRFKAKSIVVGHTLQSKINRRYKGKVIAIDVKHPKDYHKNFPNNKSEALLIEAAKYYRLLHNGDREEI